MDGVRRLHVIRWYDFHFFLNFIGAFRFRYDWIVENNFELFDAQSKRNKKNYYSRRRHNTIENAATTGKKFASPRVRVASVREQKKKKKIRSTTTLKNSDSDLNNIIIRTV